MSSNRNFFKTVAHVPGGFLPEAYIPTGEDIALLYAYEKEADGLWEVVKWCLAYGYVMGHRATVNGKYVELKGKALKERRQEIEALLQKAGIKIE